MKITGVVSETRRYVINIDTDDYNCGDGSIQGIFEFYEEVQTQPMSYVETDDDPRGSKTVELVSIKIEESK